MGAVARIAGNAMALLVVKPLNSNGPVRISHAPTTITDIPATILDGVGVAQNLPGEPALKLSEDAPRVRPWAFYDWERDDWGQNYFATLDIVEINGRCARRKQLDADRTRIYEPTAGEAARTRGLYEVHRSRSGLEYRWSMPDVFLHVPAAHALVRNENPIHCAEAANRNSLCRRSGAGQGDARRPVVGPDQVRAAASTKSRRALGARQRRSSLAGARGRRVCSASRPAASFSAP